MTGEFSRLLLRDVIQPPIRYALYAYWVLPFSYAFWNLGHPTLNDLKRSQALGRPQALRRLSGSDAPLRLWGAPQQEAPYRQKAPLRL